MNFQSTRKVTVEIEKSAAEDGKITALFRKMQDKGIATSSVYLSSRTVRFDVRASQYEYVEAYLLDVLGAEEKSIINNK